MKRRPVSPRTVRSSFGMVIGLSIFIIVMAAGLAALTFWQEMWPLGMLGVGMALLGITLLAYSCANFAAWGDPDPITALKRSVRMRKTIMLIGFVVSAVPITAAAFAFPGLDAEFGALGTALAVVIGAMAAVLLVSAIVMYVREEKYPPLLPH